MTTPTRIGAFFPVDLIRIMHTQRVGAAFADTPNGRVSFFVTAPPHGGGPRRLEVFAAGRPLGSPAVTVDLDGRSRRVAWRRIRQLLVGAAPEAIEAMGRFVEVANTLDASLAPAAGPPAPARSTALLAELRHLLGTAASP